jgi:hypothetical protein
LCSGRAAHNRKHPIKKKNIFERPELKHTATNLIIRPRRLVLCTVPARLQVVMVPVPSLSALNRGGGSGSVRQIP